MDAQFQLIDLTKITIDERLQSRDELDHNVVDEYANAITDGAKFPPPVVFFDGSTRWLAGGFHRYFAHKMAGNAGMKVEIRQGTLRDAILFSVGENQTHGIRRTIADKRRAVNMLLSDAAWGLWADREIAFKTGTSHTFVAQVRNPEKAAAKKAAGKIATPKDAAPTSNPGVTLSTPEPAAGNVATNSQVIHKSPEEEMGADPVAILSIEVDELKARLAVLAVEGSTEEERAMYSEAMKDLQAACGVLKAERDSICAQHNSLVRENTELKREVKSLRKKLDQALAKA